MSPTTTPPNGEVAEPTDRPFPTAHHLVAEGGAIHAPSHTELLSWDPDGSIVRRAPLVGADGVHTWDLRDGVVVVGGADHYTFTTMSLDDGEALGEARVDNDVTAPEDSTAQPPAFRPPRAIATDGAHVAVAFDDGTVGVFDVAGQLLNTVVPVDFRPTRDDGADHALLTYSPDGRLVLHSARNHCPVQFWHPDGSELITVLDGGPANPQHVAFAAEAGRFVVTQYASGDDAMPYVVFDSATLEPVAEGTLPDVASVVAVSPDGATLASAGGFGSGDARRIIHLVDLAGAAASGMEREDYVAQSLLFSPDAATLYSHNALAGIVAWDVAARAETLAFELPG